MAQRSSVFGDGMMRDTRIDEDDDFATLYGDGAGDAVEHSGWRTSDAPASLAACDGDFDEELTGPASLETAGEMEDDADDYGFRDDGRGGGDAGGAPPESDDESIASEVARADAREYERARAEERVLDGDADFEGEDLYSPAGDEAEAFEDGLDRPESPPLRYEVALGRRGDAATSPPRGLERRTEARDLLASVVASAFWRHDETRLLLAFVRWLEVAAAHAMGGEEAAGDDPAPAPTRAGRPPLPPPPPLARPADDDEPPEAWVSDSPLDTPEGSDDFADVSPWSEDASSPTPTELARLEASEAGRRALGGDDGRDAELEAQERALARREQDMDDRVAALEAMERDLAGRRSELSAARRALAATAVARAARAAVDRRAARRLSLRGAFGLLRPEAPPPPPPSPKANGASPNGAASPNEWAEAVTFAAAAHLERATAVNRELKKRNRTTRRRASRLAVAVLERHRREFLRRHAVGFAFSEWAATLALAPVRASREASRLREAIIALENGNSAALDAVFSHYSVAAPARSSDAKLPNGRARPRWHAAKPLALAGTARLKSRPHAVLSLCLPLERLWALTRDFGVAPALASYAYLMQLAHDVLHSKRMRTDVGRVDPDANALDRDQFANVLARLALHAAPPDDLADPPHTVAHAVDRMLVAMECSGGLAKIGLHTKRFQLTTAKRTARRPGSRSPSPGSPTRRSPRSP